MWLQLITFAIFTYGLAKFLLMLRLGQLQRKTVAISGCDTGFGHLLALRLNSLGVPVVAGCFSEKGEEELKKKATRAKLLYTHPLDVTSNESVEKFADFTRKVTGGRGLWGIVCNAGILGYSGPDDWLKAEDYMHTMSVNTFGVMRFVQKLRKFVKIQRGRIVIISSISGRTPRPMVGPYCVSKHAVEAYADVIRHEMKDFGVSVHILEPGFFTTNITQTATNDLDKVWTRLDDETRHDFGRDYFDKYKHARFSRLSHCSDDLNAVVDAYEHALLSRFPKSRYWVGLDTIFFYIPLATLPTFLQDWVITFQRKGSPIPLSMRN
ncbi:unnamed protein product, partial [Mesorhabditis belari]|uniref:17-beta-hydroxysteroid dehydrogenase type 6 n=1 Tax=Mesorhabditis belari TaxID=2138241 RepID=A0AAF3FPJ8_9BILA